jgi:hypothetical protein
MKAIEINKDKVDVYFKTLASAELFSNYWGALVGGLMDKYEFPSNKILLTADYPDPRAKNYEYTCNAFPNIKIVEGFLNIFPEERE